MTARIAGLPFWELTFDAEGDVDTGQRDALLAGVAAEGVTDLVLFSHGWNNDRAAAHRLYDGFFGLLAGLLHHVPAGRPVVLGAAGVVWPSQMWADEPIPDLGGGPAGGGGAAGLGDAAGTVTADPRIDAATLAHLRELFPDATGPLEEMAALLAAAAAGTAWGAAEEAAFHAALAAFCAQAGPPGEGDGEDDLADPAPDGQPRMLRDGPGELFGRYATALRAAGVQPSGGGGGGAGIFDRLEDLVNGAKEALRQATYWQMKNRAGTVGRVGLGPVLSALSAVPVRVHLVGHSFGARLVSNALAGLTGPSPVRAVTLLQGAFSHFAFADPLPFDHARRGALAGMMARIDGPLTVCFSAHDGAVGSFYPLASLAAGDDASGIDDPMFRWGGMGADGAQGVGAKLDGITPAGPGGTPYRFTVGGALNIDAASVVRHGPPPVGAHSDILHEELAWVVLAAGGIVG